MTAINSNRAIRGPVTAVPVVAGKGVRLTADTENNRWIVEADETVLFNTDTPQSTGDINLSESMFNFERIGISFHNDENDAVYQEFPCVSGKDIVLFCAEYHLENGTVCLYIKWGSFGTNADGTALVCQRGGYNNIYGTAKGSDTQYAWTKPYKIVGINRIASN